MLRNLALSLCLTVFCTCASISADAQTREDVFEAQRALTFLGFDTGGVDGQWGRNSARALSEFMSATGAEFDGQLDRIEMSALRRAVAGRISETVTSYALSKETGALPYPLPLLPVPERRYFQEIFRTLVDVDGDGTQELFAATALYDPREPASMAKPGYYSFFRQNERGKWRFLDLIAGDPDDICVHARKAIVADFNGDKAPDIFVSCHGWDGPPYSGEHNNVLLSQPDGTYRLSIPSADVGFFHAAAAADFNNDGHMDVIVVASTQQNPVYVLLNDGTGAFRKSSKYIPAAAKGSKTWFTLELPDIDGDGFYDIFIGGHDWERGPTQVFLNPGHNDFTKSDAITLPRVDGMGVVLDVVVSQEKVSRHIWVLRTSGGDGTFYEGVAIQKITWPDLTSEVVYQQRDVRWMPTLALWEQNGVGYVGSDDVFSKIPAIAR